MFLVVFSNGGMDIHNDPAAVINQLTRRPGTRAWEISVEHDAPVIGPECQLSAGKAVAQHVRYELLVEGEGVGFGDVKETIE